MTLILVLPTRDGIVMASDGQVTAGMVRTTGQKILCLNERCLWAASGELALIQRVEERLKILPSNASLQQLRDKICEIVKHMLCYKSTKAWNWIWRKESSSRTRSWKRR